MDEGSYKARGGESRGHDGIRMGAAATVGRMIMNACRADRDFGFWQESDNIPRVTTGQDLRNIDLSGHHII